MRVIGEHIPAMARQTGWTRPTAATTTADDHAARFGGSAAVHPKAWLEAAERAAPALRYSMSALRLLRWMHDQVRVVDWQDGRPICFASNEAMAWAIGVTIGAVKKQLRALADGGLISRTNAPNGQRRGGRIAAGPQKGKLRPDTVGINLAPLAMLYEHHLEVAERYEMDKRMMYKLAKRAMADWRECAAIKAEIERLELPCNAASELCRQAETAMVDLGRARAMRDLTTAEALSATVAELRSALATLFAEALKLQSNTMNNQPMGSKMDTHIPSTIPLISYGNVKAAKKASSSHSSTPSEMLDTDREETHTNHGVIKVSELPYLFENYRDFLGEHRTFESAERRITNGLHAFIGLKQALWIEAIKTLPPGYAVIMFAIALEFMARTQKSGAAYFVGMWRKYDRDELNLHGTIMGRRKKIAV